MRCKTDAFNLWKQFATAARKEGDKSKRFEMTRPKADANRDYRWRISLRKKAWAEIVYRLSMQITYTNFKSEVHNHKDQDNKNSAYVTIWSAMHRVQILENETQFPAEQRKFDWREDAARSTDDYFGPMDPPSFKSDDELARWMEAPIPTKTIKSVTLDEHF